MSEKDNSVPAFPTREEATIREGDKWIMRHEGMTLRDYFAGQALAGLTVGWTDLQGPYSECVGWSASAAYGIADAMLAERNR